MEAGSLLFALAALCWTAYKETWQKERSLVLRKSAQGIPGLPYGVHTIHQHEYATL